MAGLSLVAILITSVVTIFLIMNLSLNSTEKAIKLNKQLSNIKSKISPSPNFSTDKKASFVIFTNGTLRNFSASMYHNLSTDVYILSDNPNIIRIKKDGVTYEYFFKTLPFKLTNNCLTTGTGQLFCTSVDGILKFYLNGNLDANLLDRQIQDGDRVLITFGPIDDPDISLQLQQISYP